MIHSMSVFHFATLLISLTCLCYGLSVLSVLCLISTAGIGYFLGMRVVDSDDHCRLIQRYVSSLLHLQSPRSIAEPGSPGTASIQAQTPLQQAGARHRRRHLDPPWERLSLGRTLNEALEELLENVVQQYVCSWYRADISEDNAFVNEIRHQIRYAASVALKQLRKVDFSELILTDLISPFAMHIERVARLIAEKESERTDLKVPLSTLEMNVLMQFTDLHFALMSRDNERDYLRMVADLLVERLIDQSRVTGRETTATEYNKPWPSHSCRHLLREIIVSTILVPAMDFISDPDTLNKLILIALEPKSDAAADDIDTKETAFLSRLTERCQSDAPDSLLSVKLSDIVVKKGPLQQHFVLYLHDVGAPRHYYECFVYASDIHNHMHWGKGSEDELLVDAWQFYSNYLYQGANDRIDFGQRMPEDFAVAYKNRNMQALQKIIEEIYKKLYQILQYDYVIPFCQSESYLGHLCDAPPHVDELIRGPKDDEAVLNKAKTAQTATFSISQFKNRLFHVMGASEESTVEKVEPAVSATSREETLQRIHSAPAFGEVEPEVGDVALLHLGKDMSRWTISVPTIEPRKEPGTGRMYYVYCIHVCREDVPEDDPDELDLPKIWTLGRKYDEFYVLDEKLREFHGNALRLERLPEKKPFRAKSRAFMESQRTHFERYVRNLGAQPLLRRSDLLYVFLTSEEETLDSNFWPADLNIIRAVRRMPGKLARERGQNLKPFLLNILANSLAPTRGYATDATTSTHKQKKLVNSISSSGVGSDESSLASFNLTDSENGRAYQSKIALDNCRLGPPYVISQGACEGAARDNEEQHGKTSGCDECANVRTAMETWKRNVSEVVLFVLVQVGRFSEWHYAALFAIRRVFGDLADRLVYRLTDKAVEKVADQRVLLHVVQALHEVLFGGQPPTVSSEQELRLRAELAQRRIEECIGERLPSVVARVIGPRELRVSLSRVFTCIQLPRLNKQLAYVILDVLVERIRSQTNGAGTPMHYD